MNDKKMMGIAIGSIILAAGIFLIIFGLLSKKEYTVSFDTDGGSIVENQTVKSGEKVVKPTNPTKEGYDFVKWNNKENNEEYNFNSEVTSNLVLKAVWSAKVVEKKYVLTFTVGDVTKTLEVSKASDIDLSKLGFEDKSGYDLKWYVDGKEYDFETPIDKDVTIEGKYVKASTYTVKFNSDGGTTVKNKTVKGGDKVLEPENVTKEGYILDGWYVGNTKYDFSSPVTKSFTLKAKWSEDPSVIRYTVTFDTDNGTNSTTKRVIENKTVSEPTKPTKKGYVFVEWQLDGVKYDFKTKVTKDITLKAKYRELEKYTVTFTNEDGTVTYESHEIVEGNTISKPNDPTKDGYTFAGWLLDGKTFDFKTKITKSITLKASFKEVTYTVSFKTNGGTGVSSQTVKMGAKATKPNDPAKSGYTFKGWKLNGSLYDFDTPVNSNIELVAEWEEIKTNNDEYKITAKPASGVGSTDVILQVLKNDEPISVSAIKHLSGAHLCNGSNLAVAISELTEVNELIVVLTDGTEVRARIVS